MSLKFDSAKKLRKEKKKHKVKSWEDYEEREQKFLKEKYLHKEPTISGSVRITGGKAKNFKLEIPKNSRPLTDRMKVRIFDILSQDIANKIVLDLYAGTGSFGLEALSRGAKEATFIEASKRAEPILKKNITQTGSLSQSKIIKEKVEDFLTRAKEKDKVYEIVFMDPPYKLFNTKRVHKMQQTINTVSLLLPGIKYPKKKTFKGALIIKHPRKYPLKKLELEKIKKVETYNFGLNSISLFIVK